MALPADGFTLVQINRELGTTGQSLVTCIANVGKTGIWNSIFNFANYATFALSTLLAGTPLGTPTIVYISVTCSGAWTVTKSAGSWFSISGTSGFGNDTFRITFSRIATQQTGTVTVTSAGVSKIIDCYIGVPI